MTELEEEEERIDALIEYSIEYHKSIKEMQDELDSMEEECGIPSEQAA